MVLVPVPAICRIPGPPLKGGVEGDDVVADNLRTRDAKIVEDRGDPFGDAGHGGAGYAARCRAHAFDAGLRVDIFEHSAQVSFGSLRAHAQSLDGAAFRKGEHPLAVDDGGARVRAAAVDSENYAH